MSTQRFHVNGVGNPGLCKAQKGNCPFGGESDHYESEIEASRAWEKTQENPLSRKLVKRPYRAMATAELRAEAESLMERKMILKEPYSDEEYELHREWLRRIRDEYKTTQEEFSRVANGQVQYSPRREKIHQELLAELKNSASLAKAEGKSIYTGGLPSAGKTTVLKRLYGDRFNDYVLINPDTVKELMAERGLTPKIPGTLPLETNPLIHDEAQHVTNQFYRWALNERLNLIIDKTMFSADATQSSVNELQANGYEKPEGIFVDIGIYDSYKGLVKRHREGLDDAVMGRGSSLGERAVSGVSLSIVEPKDSRYFSANSESFSYLLKQNVFGSAQLFERLENSIEPVKQSLMQSRLQKLSGI